MLSRLISIIISKKNLKDEVFPRLIKNSSLLLSGNILVIPINLISLSLITNSLGAKEFGILTLVISYVGLVDRLVNFQSSQTVIKFGSDALAQKDYTYFKSIVKLCFLLDAATALIGAFLSVFLAFIIGNYLKWSNQIIWMISIYSFTTLVNISGPPSGIFRLFDRYKLITLHSIFFSILKLSTIITLCFYDLTTWMLLIGITVIESLKRIVLIFLSFREMECAKCSGFMSCNISIVMHDFKDIRKFLVSTNLHSSVKLSLSELDIFLVGIFLSPTSSGFYKIVKTIGGNFSQLTAPLYNAIYPELAAAVSSKNSKKFFNLVLKPIPIVGIVVLFSNIFFNMFGKNLIELSIGKDFLYVFFPSSIYLVGVSIAMCTFPLHPALLALGAPAKSLKILLYSSVTYILFLCVLVNFIGLIGASLSYVIFYLTWSTFQILEIHKVSQKKTFAST